MVYTRKPLHFIHTPGWLMHRMDLNWNEKAVLSVISYLVKRTGSTRAKNDYIAEQIGLKPHTVDNIISRLHKNGFLTSKLHKNVYGKVWKRDITVLYGVTPISSQEE